MCYVYSIGYKPLMVACQSQISVLNKLLATKQRSITPPPLPSPAVRSRTISTSFDASSNQYTSHSNQTLNTSVQATCSEASVLDERILNSVQDGKSNDDTVSIASQKSTSSCIIS